MKLAAKWLIATLTVAGIAITETAYATNGMFLIGYGTKARGTGGVAIAMPQDAIAGAVNPATISFVK
ncbi:MAG: long-chain fatty acid transporter, partial [Halobacteria archaeon]|nr:long-chain fatty acid transporter [Halobacteria archaeon]